MQKIGEELAKAGQGQPQAGGPAPKEKAQSEDVVEDAEVEILDKEK